ncbi:MAG: MBL fold metallo-hydrolase [Chloroflexi bacterium]|nr:MBL fold metallo-hydrolase [Chloroflexota bacterium]
MEIERIVVSPVEANCYVVVCPETREAAVIDPGWPDTRILWAIEDHEAQVKIILNTHAHWDHIGGNAELKRLTNAPIALHQADMLLLKMKGGAPLMGFDIEASPKPDLWLEHGQTVSVGRLNLEVLYTPGHAPGHVAFFEATQGVVFSGDALFRGSIGRTDLPGGKFETLQASIREQLNTLPHEVLVYCGHGPETTIGEEKRHNPFVRPA